MGRRVFFIAEKTLFLAETMVSTSDKTICVTDTTVPVNRSMVFAKDKIFIEKCGKRRTIVHAVAGYH
jgi:hypothetical protein